MQINRLLEIVYILLNKKCVTAKELSQHFSVSERTIYRDIDVLSSSGIPIYTVKGKGGGISLLDNFILNKSMLSDKEQLDILSSLQGISALNVPNVENVIIKLGAVFNKNITSWIDVDFSNWGSEAHEREKFNILKEAILNKNLINFDYFSSYGEKSTRVIEPLRIIFKGQSWYIYGFCRSKNDYRLFKITRIKNLICLKENFERQIPNIKRKEPKDYSKSFIKLVLKIEERMSYRVYDEFDEKNIVKNSDGSFTATIYFPEDEWVYEYILSYGNYAEVLEPYHIREIIKYKIQLSLKKYL